MSRKPELLPLLALLACCFAISSQSLGKDGGSVYSGLTAHEWGTFTSIAGSDGQAVEWSPLSGSTDLPAFVEHFRHHGMVSPCQPRRAGGRSLWRKSPQSRRQRPHRLGFRHACAKWESGFPNRRPKQSLLRSTNDFFDPRASEDGVWRSAGKISLLSRCLHIFRAPFRNTRRGREASDQKSRRSGNPDDRSL